VPTHGTCQFLIGCAFGFAKKNFSLPSGTKRNEIRVARSREKEYFFWSLLFASDQSEINTAIFRFVSLPKIFRFASDFFVSLQSETKRFFSFV
jgi:hypothetical protein